MQQSGIDTDDERGTGNQPRHFIERQALADTRAGNARRDTLSPRTLGVAAPWQDQVKAIAAKRIAERDPIFLRPFFFRSCSRVQQHGIARARRHQAGAVEPEVRRPLRRKAKRASR